MAKGLFCRETPLLYDILIVSAGGFPKDRNLYQASKAIENCYRAVVPGGKLILIAECREGIGDSYFAEWMTACTSYEAAEARIRSDFVLGGHKAYYMRLAMARLRLSIVSRLDSQLLTRWGIQAYQTLGEALEALRKERSKIGLVKKGVDTLLVPAIK